MRRETSAERAAWTAHVDGTTQPKASKYGNVRAGGYASKYEAEVAGKLHALAACGKIQNLREQVPMTLVEGRGKIRPIKYVADFVYEENGMKHILDAKGCKTPVYRLKRKLAALLHNIDIEEC